MNIKNILSILLTKYENDSTISKTILNDMRDAILEMNIAESIFNSVDDPNLIDVAIYREQAAKKKIDYLLSIAKEEIARVKTIEGIDTESEIEV